MTRDDQEGKSIFACSHVTTVVGIRATADQSTPQETKSTKKTKQKKGGGETPAMASRAKYLHVPPVTAVVAILATANRSMDTGRQTNKK